MQTVIVFATEHHAQPSPVGIGWTAASAAVMLCLAVGKRITGEALDNPVLVAGRHVTVLDGLLALAVLTGLALNAVLGCWWADPAAGLVIVYYALRESRTIRTNLRLAGPMSTPLQGYPIVPGRVEAKSGARPCAVRQLPGGSAGGGGRR